MTAPEEPVLLDEPVLPIAAALLSELTAQLAASIYPVCRVGFAFGDPATADSCCECASGSSTGSAWVRLGQIVPSSQFPRPVADPAPCTTLGLAVTFTLGIWRCAPVITNNADPPSVADLAAALVVQTQDAALLRRVIRCALGEDGADVLHVDGPWNPIEPSGGCMGGSLIVTVQAEDCGDCP